MKNLIAAAVLCSISVFIGLAGGVGFTYFQKSMEIQELYDIMKTCQTYKADDGDLETMHKLMFLKAMNTDNAETKVKYEQMIFSALLKDAAELDKQIEDNVSDIELRSKKDLLKDIEEFIEETDAKYKS